MQALSYTPHKDDS